MGSSAIFVFAFVLNPSASSLSSPSTKMSPLPYTTCHLFAPSSRFSFSTQLGIVWDPLSAEVGSEWVDFPTASQKTELKKEAKRRTARKEMPLYFLEHDEMNGPWSPETFQDVWTLLVEHEMVTLKGICRDDRKAVYETAQMFCAALEEMISASQGGDDGDDEEDENESVFLPVAVLSYQGHSALIYCPTLPNDHPNKFLLRTSVGQKNVWSPRPRPLRDDRGQITKSRKEMMEMMEMEADEEED